MAAYGSYSQQQGDIHQILNSYGYQYQNAGGDINRIRRDVQDLQRTCSSLKPNGGNQYTHKNGKVSTLIKLVGTCPIVYKGVTYHIPVSIWIPELYPFVSPICYVTPTLDMVVTPRHPHVQADGLVVHLQYLSSWQSGGSTLSALVSSLSSVFSDRPPCQAKPPGYSTNPAAMGNVVVSGGQYGNGVNGGQYSKNTSGQYGSGGNLRSYAAPSYNNIAANPPTYSSTLAAASAASVQEPVRPPRPDISKAGGKAHNNTADDLTQSTCAHLEGMLKAKKRQMDEALTTTVKLERSEQALAEGVAKLKEQESTLAGYIAAMKIKNANIADWLVENEAQDVDIGNDPEKVLVGGDMWSNQMFDEVARSVAIEDTLFHLDEALKSQRIQLKPFLRQVRNLSAKQFQAKALAKKIRDAQEQNPIRRGGSGAMSRAPPSYNSYK